MRSSKAVAKGALTRQRIIETAAPLFNRLGFSDCSMRDLMNATGLEKGGIYRHFESKQKLAVEAFRYALATTHDVRFIDLTSCRSATDKLLHLVALFVEGPSPLPGGCPLLNMGADQHDGNSELHDIAMEGLVEWKSRLEEILIEGIASGEISAAVEPGQITNAFIAILEGSLMISRLEGRWTAMLDARKTLGDMIIALRSGR